MLKGSNSYRNGSLSLSIHPIEYAGIDPSLARSVPPSILTEVSKEVKKAEAEARPKKRGTYLTFTAKEKARVATYGSINGASRVTKFKTRRINSEDPRQLFTKICTPEYYPLYIYTVLLASGASPTLIVQRRKIFVIYIYIYIYIYI